VLTGTIGAQHVESWESLVAPNCGIILDRRDATYSIVNSKSQWFWPKNNDLRKQGDPARAFVNWDREHIVDKQIVGSSGRNQSVISFLKTKPAVSKVVGAFFDMEDFESHLGSHYTNNSEFSAAVSITEPVASDGQFCLVDLEIREPALDETHTQTLSASRGALGFQVAGGIDNCEAFFSIGSVKRAGNFSIAGSTEAKPCIAVSGKVIIGGTSNQTHTEVTWNDLDLNISNNRKIISRDGGFIGEAVITASEYNEEESLTYLELQNDGATTLRSFQVGDLVYYKVQYGDQIGSRYTRHITSEYFGRKFPGVVYRDEFFTGSSALNLGQDNAGFLINPEDINENAFGQMFPRSLTFENAILIRPTSSSISNTTKFFLPLRVPIDTTEPTTQAKSQYGGAALHTINKHLNLMLHGYAGPTDSVLLTNSSTDQVSEKLVSVKNLLPEGDFLKLTIQNTSGYIPASVEVVEQNCYSIGDPLEQSRSGTQINRFIYPLAQGEDYRVNHKYTYTNGEVKEFIIQGEVSHTRNCLVHMNGQGTNPDWSDRGNSTIPTMSSASLALEGNDVARLVLKIDGVSQSHQRLYGKKKIFSTSVQSQSGGTVQNHDDINLIKCSDIENPGTLIMDECIFVPNKTSSTWSCTVRYQFAAFPPNRFDVTFSGTWSPEYGIKIIGADGNTKMDGIGDYARSVGSALNKTGSVYIFGTPDLFTIYDETVSAANIDKFMGLQNYPMSRTGFDYENAPSDNRVRWYPTNTTWTGDTNQLGVIHRTLILEHINPNAPINPFLTSDAKGYGKSNIVLRGTVSGSDQEIGSYTFYGYHNSTGPLHAGGTWSGVSIGGSQGNLRIASGPVYNWQRLEVDTYDNDDLGADKENRKIMCAGVMRKYGSTDGFWIYSLEGNNITDHDDEFHRITFSSMTQMLRRSEASYKFNLNGCTTWIWKQEGSSTDADWLYTFMEMNTMNNFLTIMRSAYHSGKDFCNNCSSGAVFKLEDG
jgi:hypothetical protein